MKGGILTEDFIIEPSLNWADYVFEEDYDLMPLKEVETYILEKGHLPKTPNSDYFENNWIRAAEVIVMQQEKIEELFLHSIALENENQELKNKLNEIEEKINMINAKFD